jgi:hypothetical protein
MGKVGRPSLGLKNVLVGFPADVLLRLDAAVGSGGRAEFIRGAVVSALDGSAAPVVELAEKSDLVAAAVEVAVPVPEKKNSEVIPARGADDPRVAVLLSALRKSVMTEGEAARALGWPPVLVAKVASRLSARGLIHYPRGNGLMVVVE